MYEELYRSIYSRKAKQDESIHCMLYGLGARMKADSCTRQADRHDRQNDTKINREGMRHRVKEGVGVKTEDQYRGEGMVGRDWEQEERTKHTKHNRKR